MIAPIRVLVVDDSPFTRYTIAKHLDADPGVTVVGSAHNGLDALAKIPALTPDVITLDVEMPHLGSLNTLHRIMSDFPTPIVMLSSRTQRGTCMTIQALMSGAIDFVPKPTASTDIRTVIEELILKVKTAARVTLNATAHIGRQTAKNHSPLAVARPTAVKSKLHPFLTNDPVIVIGASTGGPRALKQILSGLPAALPAAVIVVQHMPPGFTRSLAQRLNEASALTIREADNGDCLMRGLALLAPGDFHLRFESGHQITLDHGPRRHHVRPALDVTIESAVEHYESAVIGVILTGMGSDGTEGAGLIKAAGGQVIAEHESTSVVYSMPRSVAVAGLTDRMIPLPQVASTLVELVAKRSLYGQNN